jgi:multidrug efflux pump
MNARAFAAFSKIRDAVVFPLVPPAIRGLGQSSGFTFELLNTANVDRATFEGLRDKLIAAANADPKLAQVRAATLVDAPQLRVDIDEAKLAVLGLTESDVTATLSTAWGSTYVNDFVDRGRVKRVYVQGLIPRACCPAISSSGMSAPRPMATWCPSRPLHPRAGKRAPTSSRASMGSRPMNSRAAPVRASARAMPWPKWSRSRRRSRLS